jgi:nitrite reductase (NO-forming)
MKKPLWLVIGLGLVALAVVACGADATPRPQAAPASKEPVDLPALLKATVPPPITRKEPALVKVGLEVKELDARLDDGVGYTYWTFNGSVPGPFIRVREGDTVELTLKNPQGNFIPHNIDLHAVNGPGGGATLTNVRPGEEAAFRFKAMNPGIYIYHCATPPVPHHITKGMYGLVLVEPEAGIPPVDKEFYVVQGDIYIDGQRGDKGLRGDSLAKLVDERADYVVFNGSVGALMGDNALKAAVGDTVRIYFGVGGPNVISSFHVIGEIFDRVYPEGALANPHYNVQTTLVPAGGATMVEFKIDVPGTYLLVDHSLSRLFKGAVGQIVATGAEDPAVFSPMGKGQPQPTGH